MKGYGTFWVSLFAAMAVLGGVSGAQPKAADEEAARATREWQLREQPGHTEAAIVHWKNAVQQDPGRVELYTALTRACGRAYRHSVTSRDKRRWADEGRTYGALAIANNPGSPAAYAEYAAALGQWAEAHKGFHSLGAVRKAIDSLNKSLELDPQYAYAHMLLAAFYHRSPGWPLSVGNIKKSLQHAQLAVQYDPASAINHVILAKIYISLDRKAEARQELEKTLSLTPPPDAVPETRADQADAREMLKSL